MRPLNDDNLCLTEIDALSRRLKKHGIVATKIGIELEFSLSDEPEGSSLWEDVKADIINELEEQMRLLPHSRRAALQDKIDEVTQFNAREVLMYDLIERDPRTKSILEPLFGRDHGGDGYYDGDNCLELKIVQADADDALSNQRLVQNVLREKAAAFGLPFTGYPSAHVNVSFWTKDGNVFEGSSADKQRQERDISAGMARGLYECLPLIANEPMLENEMGHATFDLDFSRSNLLRRASNRIEVRLAANPEDQDLPAVMVVAMASALQGLEHGSSQPGMIPALPERNAAIHFEDERYKLLAHILSNSILADDGSVQLPEEYLKHQADHIGYALGLTPSKPHPFEALFTGLPRYMEGMRNFLEKIKIEKEEGQEEYRIVWPRTDDDTFTFHVPPINMDKIPEPLQKRIMGGEDPEAMMDELMEHLGFGNFVPRPGYDACIEVSMLEYEGAVWCTGVTPMYVVTPGYDLNDMTGYEGKTLAQARLGRLMNSRMLMENTSPAFRQAVLKQVLSPSPNKRAPAPEFAPL